MAIYRPRGSRWRGLALAFVLGLVVGVIAGVAILGGRPASLDDAASTIGYGLDGAASLLEVVGIEYGEAVVDGQVASPVEYQGSLDALARSRERYAQVSSALTALDPERATAVAAAYDRVEGLMRRPAPVDELEPALDQLATLLRGDPAP